MGKREVAIALGVVFALSWVVKGSPAPRFEDPVAAVTPVVSPSRGPSTGDIRKENSLPSFKERVDVLMALQASELDRRLNDVEAKLESGHWIQRANSNQLKEDERRELLALIREQGAIHAVQTERLIHE